MTDLSSPLRVIQTDFRSGEVDPRLVMRVDSKLYPSGALSLKNCLMSAAGSVSRRPGTTRLATLSGKRRLISFEYDSDEKYIFAFGVNALEIYDASGTLVTSFSGSTNCPWGSAGVVSSMTFAQAADVMIICDRTFRPKVIRRTSLSTFAVSDFAFDTASNSAQIYQPYVKFEQASVTLAISATAAGTGRTVTASSPIFSAAWVGDTIRIFGVECTVTGYTNATTITVTSKKDVKVRLDPNPFLYTDGSAVIEVTHVFHGMATGASVTISGSNDVYGTVRTNINGAKTITVIDEDRYQITAANADVATESADGGGSAVTIATTAGTRQWDEQAFSSRRGWPQACVFHEDRLWFGGTTFVPDGIWSSRTGQYFNFDPAEGQDDGSIQISIGSPRVAQVKHMLSNRVLQIFTEGAEFVASQSDGASLTPSTISVRPQTPYGSTDVRPRSFDGATLFVQSNGKTIREFTYSFGEDAFQSTEITTLSSHLVKDVQSFDVLYGSTTRTEQYAFFVNGDGTMAVFHSNRAEQLASWAPWSTVAGDLFESVCVLETKTFVSVNRGGTRYLERLEMDDDTVLLDSQTVLTSGSPQISWALGAGYASRTVAVISGSSYIGNYTANGSGTITLPAGSGVTSIKAGFNYPWEVIPLPVDTQLADGPMTGVKRRVSSVTTHVRNTLSLNVNGRPVVTPDQGSTTGKVRRFLFGYGRDPAVTFTQSQPYPVTILGIVMEVSL